jgi:hypothetical protein
VRPLFRIRGNQDEIDIGKRKTFLAVALFFIGEGVRAGPLFCTAGYGFISGPEAFFCFFWIMKFFGIMRKIGFYVEKGECNA